MRIVLSDTRRRATSTRESIFSIRLLFALAHLDLCRFTIRTRYIQEAVRRYKAPRAAEEFMHRLYPLKAEYLKSSATTPTPSSPRPAALSVPVMPLSLSSSSVNNNASKAPPSPLSRSISIGPHDPAAVKFNPQVKRPPPPAVKRDSTNNNK